MDLNAVIRPKGFDVLNRGVNFTSNQTFDINLNVVQDYISWVRHVYLRLPKKTFSFIPSGEFPQFLKEKSIQLIKRAGSELSL